MSGIKDFTRARERLQFTIDGDVFEAAPALPAKVLAEFVTRYTTSTDGMVDEYNAIVGAIGLVLFPESNEVFQKRLGSLEHPIELDQASDIVIWLLEQYGPHPAQPSSPSPSPVSGTSSTDDVQPAVSIPATFQLTGS